MIFCISPLYGTKFFEFFARFFNDISLFFVHLINKNKSIQVLVVFFYIQADLSMKGGGVGPIRSLTPQIGLKMFSHIDTPLLSNSSRINKAPLQPDVRMNKSAQGKTKDGDHCIDDQHASKVIIRLPKLKHLLGVSRSTVYGCGQWLLAAGHVLRWNAGHRSNAHDRACGVQQHPDDCAA